MAEMWDRMDAIGVMFMYAKDLHGSADTFLSFARLLAIALIADGYHTEARQLSTRVSQVESMMRAYSDMRTGMIDEIGGADKRQEASRQQLPQIMTSMARDAALYALDYASITRHGRFQLRFSMEMANEFRALVGNNPYTNDANTHRQS